MIKEIPEKNLDNGKRYWKSLDDLAETPGFRSWVEREFPEGASMLEGVQRRGFVKLMAASFGLAGLGMTGCRRPEHTILPYGKSPEELIPGVPNFYATSMPTAQGNIPLIVESHNGRPTKIEGNPSYIPFGGSTNIYAQASVLDIYDSDRTRNPVVIDSKDNSDSKPLTSLDILDYTSEWMQNGKVAILADKSFSSAREQLKQQLISKGVLWCEHEAIDLTKPEINLGKAFGLNNGLRMIPNLRKASRVLSLDSDFLGNREPNSLANTRALMKGRKVLSANDAKKMNRLYSVESDLTITGGVADHRLRLDSSQFIAFSNLLTAEVLTLLSKGDDKLIEHLNQRGASLKRHKKWIIECAKDLCKKPQESVILPGSHLPTEVHALSFMLNQELGAIGNTVDYHHTNSSESTISDLFNSVNNRTVDTVIFLGGNPVLTASDYEWEDFSTKIKNKLHLGHSFNETSSICNFHLGQSHFLESWDEGQTWDGTAIVPVQPLVAPLFDTISDIELLLSLIGSDVSSHDFVLSLQEKRSAKKSFKDFLRLGVEKLKPTIQSSKFELSKLNQFKDETTKQPSSENLEVLLVPDFHAWDGRFANNGWMQECPDPISKLTWDNALLISPVLAKELEEKYPSLGLLPKPTMLNNNGQIAPDNAVFDHGKQKAPIVKLALSENKFIEGPLYVQPGLADFTIIASLGLGRRNIGNVGKGTGYNSYPLLNKESNRIISKVSLEPTGEFKILANVQEHWSMEGRAIVREGNAEEYITDEAFASHMGAESHSPKIWGKDQEADLAFKAKT
ncbi:MAG: TAT-variant-translocated molybdopterin oxidoreductase, partial [Opitutae bacterium]|nr:TAT-variant-translocated molybdopterin oxidoreductase [Opitutae bacterium]